MPGWWTRTGRRPSRSRGRSSGQRTGFGAAGVWSTPGRGRPGALDAAECPPTFSTPPAMVVGLIAGGATALTRAVEGAEDDPDRGAADLAAIQVGSADLVVGI